LIADIIRRVEQSLEPFAFALDWFLADLFRGRLPMNWRDRWHAFVAEQAEHGFFVEPQSVRELEAWIEAWARYCGLLPLAVQPTAEEQPRNQRVVRRLTATRPTQQAIQEQFFDQQLAAAEGYLGELERLLDALGARLDAAKIGETVDVDTQADQVEELIWRYHDALESARDAWLRDDLSGEANARLLSLRTPATFGLPLFLDDQQAERARRQEAHISGRLGARNVTMDRIVAGMNAVEFAGNVAGIAVGAGVVITTAKQGGRWAVVKTITVGAALITAEQAAEKGLRAAGAGEQTIRGVRLAVAVITLILLRRKSAANTAEAKSPSPKPISAEPSPQPRPPSSPPNAKATSGAAAAPESMEGAAVNRGVWDKGPVTRGEIIHERMGQNVPKTFPVIDKFEGGVVTSIKSIDLHAKTYSDPRAITRVGQGFIDKVAGFTRGTRGNFDIRESKIRGRALDLVVPPGATPGQREALEGLKAYGTTNGVTVRIVEIDR
jgi:hypothetical protein